MPKIVIVNSENGQFWTGSKWSAEYPEARIFTTRAVATAMVQQSTERLKLRLVRNYGTAFQTEETVPPILIPESRVKLQVVEFEIVCPHCDEGIASGNQAEWPQTKTVHCDTCDIDVSVPQKRIEKLFT